MKTANSGSLPTPMGPRRAPASSNETEYPHNWAPKESGSWKRALWIVPLSIVSIGLVAAAALRYGNESAPAPRYVGQVIKEATFESGSLTDVVTGFEAIRNGVTLEKDVPMKGLYSAHLSGGSAYLEEPLPGTSDLYVSFYIRLMELPPDGDLRLVRISSGRTTVGNLVVRGGRLRLRVDRTAVGPASDPLVPGQLYRIGVHQRAGTGSNAVLEAFLADGDMPFAAPFAATTNGVWTEAADRLRLGMTTSNGVNALIDDVRLQADEMAPPSK